MPNASNADKPTTQRSSDDLLLEFLRENDAECPVCGYNLRALTRTICPECKQQLTIAVGAKRLHMGWLFAALAPGFFSGIAACFLLIPIMGQLVFGDGRFEVPMVAVDLFGFTSGIAAIILARLRHRFLAQPRSRQMFLAIVAWLIHAVALAMFIGLVTMYY